VHLFPAILSPLSLNFLSHLSQGHPVHSRSSDAPVSALPSPPSHPPCLTLGALPRLPWFLEPTSVSRGASLGPPEVLSLIPLYLVNPTANSLPPLSCQGRNEAIASYPGMHQSF
jgi:hypothetical protein